MATAPGTTRSPQRLATIGLLAVTIIWGSTFFLFKDLGTRLPVPDMLAVRFVLGALALTVLAPRAVQRLTPTERTRAVLLGLLYAAAQLLQTAGLQHTSASVSGFLTGLYVVATPLLALVLLKTRMSRGAWGAVALAAAGLAVLSLNGLSLGGGETVTLVAAVFYAGHIVGLGAWSRSDATLGLTVVQLWTVAAVCTVTALPGGVQLPQGGGDWAAMLFAALVAGTLALVVQTWAQAHLAPARAAVVMTMEPVWAATFAVLLGGEMLTGRLLVGGSLVLAAMWLAERPSKEPIEGLAERLTDPQAQHAWSEAARSPRGSTTTADRPCQAEALASSAASADATTAGS